MDIEIEHRLRQPPPAECCAVPGSTPVLSFGDPHTATIATLGLNPSKAEFTDRYGRLLIGNQARFETMGSLNVTDLATASIAAVERVWVGCQRYFERRPYDRWFKPLNAALAGANASYYAGTACHLDLSPWSTDPVWRTLAASVRRQLVADGLRFLRWQLETGSVELLVLNGKTVIGAFEDAFGMVLSRAGTDGPGGNRMHFVQGRLGRAAVVGWSTNLQSSFGVTHDIRMRMHDAVADRWSRRRAS